MSRLFAFAILGLFALGCGQAPAPATDVQASAQQTTARPGGMMAPPMAPAQSSPEEATQLVQFRTDYEVAKAAYKMAAEDQKIKERYIVSTVRLGTAIMTAASLPPKQKYPDALRLYRDAPVVDPNNREAKSNSKLIEDIYKSMGRPVPK